MRFQIRSVVLWPRDSSLEPRVVSFQAGVLNVITGASKTGKSAIIPIVDYCLGSDRCAIPVETIRDATAWFGILVETKKGQLLLCRREPQAQRSTSDMFVLEGKAVSIPRTITSKNATTDAVKSLLDDLAGLTKLDFGSDSSGSSFKLRPSFRDLPAFIFQPQNIIANPDVFFFKADTYQHREKLKTIFPYVLNAITPELLGVQHELDVVRQELARKERELASLRQTSERWLADLHARAATARELGLIEKPLPPNATRDDLVELLRAVLQRPPTVTPTPASIDEAIKEVVSLQSEDAETATRLSALRRRYSEMEKLLDSSKTYQSALSIQRDRLALSTWLRGMATARGTCPLCESEIEHPDNHLEELCDALESIERESETAGGIPASFERELLRVKKEITGATERLAAIQIRRRAIESKSKDAQTQRFRSDAASRFLGSLEQALQTHDALATDGSLASEVAELRERQATLQQKISAAGINDRVRRALDNVALRAGLLLPDLDTERPKDPISLSISDLSISIQGSGRTDYLWEIGSGANWLSYHVACSLALQGFFIDSGASPVPSFLIYDQPSQVYFPTRLVTRKAPTPEELDPKLEDEDTVAVRKVFATIARVVDEMKGELQVIVLDHAGPDVWSGLKSVKLVEEWRGGTKLVPPSWLEKPS